MIDKTERLVERAERACALLQVRLGGGGQGPEVGVWDGVAQGLHMALGCVLGGRYGVSWGQLACSLPRNGLHDCYTSPGRPERLAAIPALLALMT